MRCISFVIFLTFSSCFVALPALENVTQANEFELLERLERKVASSNGANREWVAIDGYCLMNLQKYSKIKIDEDGTFSLIQTAQDKGWSWTSTIKGNLQQNEAKAFDVTDENISLTNFNAKQDGEAWKIILTWTWTSGTPGSCDAITVLSPKSAPYQEWVAENGYCGSNAQGFTNINIEKDGTFHLVQFYDPSPWDFYAFIEGNLNKPKEASLVRGESYLGNSRFLGFRAKQEGEAWKIIVTWRGCNVQTTIKPK